MSNKMYYQTLDKTGISHPDDDVDLVYRVEHSFRINENWVWIK